MRCERKLDIVSRTKPVKVYRPLYVCLELMNPWHAPLVWRRRPERHPCSIVVSGCNECQICVEPVTDVPGICLANVD